MMKNRKRSQQECDLAILLSRMLFEHEALYHERTEICRITSYERLAEDAETNIEAIHASALLENNDLDRRDLRAESRELICELRELAAWSAPLPCGRQVYYDNGTTDFDFILKDALT